MRKSQVNELTKPPILTFWIPGPSAAQKRAGSRRPDSSRRRRFNPSDKDKKRIGTYALEAMNATGFKIWRNTPLILLARFVRRSPSATGGARQEAFTGVDIRNPDISIPDLDNYLILIMNSIQGIVYDNDSRIVAVAMLKEVANKPGTTIEISEFRPIRDGAMLRRLSKGRQDAPTPF